MLEESKVEIIASALRSRIQNGEFGVGGRLPSIVTIARAHDAARPTVYQAINLLKSEGLLISRGNALYAHNLNRVATSVVPPFEEVLLNRGSASTVRNIIEPEVTVMPDAIAAMFGVEKGLHVIHRYRVQGKTDIPYRLSEYWFPEHLALSYLQRLKDEPGYDIIEDIKSDLQVTRQLVHDDVVARVPTKNEAELLSIVRGTPVLEVRRTNRTLDRQVIMHHLIVFVGTLSMLGYDYELENRKPLLGR